jgi:F-type H+-transporting ATPase subunit gamma
VRNTQQITKAMKMVSAARLRRAQDRVLLARPYAAILGELLADVAGAARGDERLAAHPLLVKRPEERIQLMLLTSDRGLAGAFNSNLIKASLRFLEEHSGASVEMELLGRKGRDFYRKRKAKITGEYVGLFNKALYEEVAPIARKVIERYRDREVDAVYLLYNEFKSVMAQQVLVSRVLPVELPEDTQRIDYIYEQAPLDLLETLLPRYVEISLHHAVLESAAAEHGARMTAMDAATSNAAEMIDKLTLYMNRVRQASITREIIEVVSGASALA